MEAYIELIIGILLGLAGQFIHIGLELIKRMRELITNEDPDDDVFDWGYWWDRNGALTIISIATVSVAVVAIYFVTDGTTVTSVWVMRLLYLTMGYAGDSGIKNVFKKYTPKEE